MRKELIILLILFGVFLAIGCTGNKSEALNNTVTQNNAVTPATIDNREGMMDNRTEMMGNRTGMMDNKTEMMGNRP